jgi:putative tryptophan/tyrosine transport system substrate-binding protein
MRRREFIARLCAAGAYATVPHLARAQQGTHMRRVALLVAGDEDQGFTTNWVGLRNELARLGWVEGRNLQIDVRFGQGNLNRMRANVAELIGLGPDVIIANGVTTRIVKEQTQTIPIVVAEAGDVFAYGLVKNLARPEGNITGITNSFSSITGKWVELLKEAVPRIERVAYIYDPEIQQQLPDELEKVSRTFAVRITGVPFHNSVDLVRGIDAFAAEPDGGLVIAPHVTANYRATINTLAIQYRLPTINVGRGWEGGLIFYDARQTDIVLRVASFVDRILRGAKPGDLPFEYPTRFELVVNLKTAKAIGVTIPEAFLVRADEVIE